MSKSIKMRKTAMYKAFWDTYLDQKKEAQSYEQEVNAINFYSWKESRTELLKALPTKDRAALREFHKNELEKRAGFYMRVLDRSLFKRKRRKRGEQSEAVA